MTDTRALLNSAAASLAVGIGIILQNLTNLQLWEVGLLSVVTYIIAKFCLTVATTMRESLQALHETRPSAESGRNRPVATEV